MKKCWEKKQVVEQKWVQIWASSQRLSKLFGIEFLLPLLIRSGIVHGWSQSWKIRCQKGCWPQKGHQKRRQTKKRWGTLVWYLFLTCSSCFSYVFLMFSLYCLILSYICIFCWIVLSHLFVACKYLEGLCMISIKANQWGSCLRKSDQIKSNFAWVMSQTFFSRWKKYQFG